MRTDYFIDGTQPQAPGQEPSGGGGILSKLFHSVTGSSAQSPAPAAPAPGTTPENPEAAKPPEPQKEGVLKKKIFSIFKSKSDSPNPPDNEKK